ncbi:MAG: diguanylate cyclase [Nocardioides sp.]
MDLRPLFDSQPPAMRPTTGSALPFLVVAFLGMTVLFLPPSTRTPLHLSLAIAMFVVLLAISRLLLKRAEHGLLDSVPALGAFPLIVVLRDATGGSSSGLVPLLLLPVLWLALYGTRRDLMASAFLVVLTFTLPIVIIGEPGYPVGEWRRAFLGGVMTVLIAPVVQEVVRQLAVETRRSRESAARVEGILRGATLSSLVTTDADGVIRTFSTGAERELGYRESDVVGRELSSLLLTRSELGEAAHQLGVPAGFTVLARLAHQRAKSRIWTFVRADGQHAFMRMAVTELRDDEGRINGYLCVAIDATPAIRSQRSLTVAEERWRILMDHLPDTTVVLVEEDAGITVVTGAGTLATRLRDGAGRRLTEIVDRDGPGRMQRLLDEAYAGHEPGPIEALVGNREHEVVASPLPSASASERRQAIVMIRDVSEERRRERSLTEALQRAERLFADAPQGIAVLDLDGVVLQVNPALAALLGQEGLVGRPLTLRSFAEGDPTVEEHLHRVRTSAGGQAENQWSVRGRDGEERHVVLSSTLLQSGRSGDAAEDTVLSNVVDVSERYRYERQLAFLAEHDPLTGLANRRRFDQQLERHVDDCRRYGARGAVLMLDLDRFKEVNDTLGHGMGDQLLRDVARVMSQRMRSTDLVARVGGDEFAVLLPYADRKTAETVAADIVDCVRGEVRSHDDTRRHVSVSLGGATVESFHASASDLLSAADAAMYVAKNSGRDRFTFLTTRQPPA